MENNVVLVLLILLFWIAVIGGAIYWMRTHPVFPRRHQ